MYVAVGTIDVRIPSSRSLKDKRQTVRKLADRLRSRVSLSVAEVGGHELRQRSLLGWSSVGAELAVLNRLESKVRRIVEGIPEIESFRLESECMKWGDE